MSKETPITAHNDTAFCIPQTTYGKVCQYYLIMGMQPRHMPTKLPIHIIMSV